jgi:hypothetical protein
MCTTLLLTAGFLEKSVGMQVYSFVHFCMDKLGGFNDIVLV